MDSKNCTALVPYVAKTQKISSLSAYFKTRRKQLVSLLFIFSMFSCVGALYFQLFHSAGREAEYFERIIASYGALPVRTVLFVLLLTFSFTVFSPAASFLFLANQSFYTGFQLSAIYAETGLSDDAALYFCAEALFVFFTLLFCSELCDRMKIAKYGIKVAAGKRYNIRLTCVFLLYITVFILHDTLLFYIN